MGAREPEGGGRSELIGERAAVCKPATDLHEVSCCSDVLLPGFAQMHTLCPFAASNLSAAGGPGCTSDASFAVAAPLPLCILASPLTRGSPVESTLLRGRRPRSVWLLAT